MKRAIVLLQPSAMVVVVVVVLMITSLPPLADAEADDHMCHKCTPYTNDCNQCATGRCCSPFRFCGSSYGYCTACFCGEDICHPCHCLGNCPPNQNQQQQQLPSGYDDGRNATNSGTAPNRDRDDGKLLLVATYEPELDRPVSSHVRNISSSVGNRERGYDQYGSAAAICTNNISSNIVPGQCLQVTNPENEKQAMVRITMKIYCANTSLALDYQVFQHLGNGNPRAHQLPISYNYVQCIKT